MNKLNRSIELFKKGELFWKIKEKISVCFVKNKIIKNDILEDKEYRRLYKKYYNLIKDRKITNNMKLGDKVWVFWYQGIDSAPILVKKCIESIKKTFNDKEVIILTKDNYEKYIEFPEYIMKKFKKGTITFTHFSDLLRISLLAKYGGIWCDATLYFTGRIPDYVKNADLFVFKNIDLDRSDENPIVASNWFIVSKSNNDIITATRDLLFEYYKKEKIIKNYFFFHLFFTMATKKYNELWDKIPTFSNVNPHILQFELLNQYDEERFKQIKDISFVHKLNKVIEGKEKNTFYDYITRGKNEKK